MARRAAGKETRRTKPCGFEDLSREEIGSVMLNDGTGEEGFQLPSSMENGLTSTQAIVAVEIMRNSLSNLSDGTRIDVNVETVLWEIDGYYSDLEALLFRIPGGSSAMSKVAEQDKEELVEATHLFANRWGTEILAYLQKKLESLAEKLENGMSCMGDEVQYSILGRQLSRACGDQRVLGWNIDQTEWKRFAPSFLGHDLDSSKLELYSLHNLYQERIYLNNDDEKPKLFYLIWKNLKYLHRALLQDSNVFPGPEYCTESEYFQYQGIDGLFQWNSTSGDCFFPREVEGLVSYYCLLLQRQEMQMKLTPGQYDGVDADLPLDNGTIELLSWHTKEEEWSQYTDWDDLVLEALHLAALRLNYLSNGPVIFRRHGKVSQEWWNSDEIVSDDLTVLLEGGGGPRIPRRFEYKQPSILTGPQAKAGGMEVTVLSATRNSNAAKTLGRQYNPPAQSMPEMPLQAQRSYQKGRSSRLASLSPVSSKGFLYSTVGGTATPGETLASLQRDAVAETNAADNIPGGSNASGVEAPPKPYTLPRGRNMTSLDDYVKYPWPETRAFEVVASKRMSREMADPGIYTEGDRLEDLVNMPRYHCRDPSSATLFRRRTPLGPVDFAFYLGKGLWNLLRGKRRDSVRPIIPPSLISRLSCRHYKHARKPRHERKGRVTKPATMRLPKVVGGGSRAHPPSMNTIELVDGFPADYFQFSQTSDPEAGIYQDPEIFDDGQFPVRPTNGNGPARADSTSNSIGQENDPENIQATSRGPLRELPSLPGQQSPHPPFGGGQRQAWQTCHPCPVFPGQFHHWCASHDDPDGDAECDGVHQYIPTSDANASQAPDPNIDPRLAARRITGGIGISDRPATHHNLFRPTNRLQTQRTRGTPPEPPERDTESDAIPTPTPRERRRFQQRRSVVNDGAGNQNTASQGLNNYPIADNDPQRRIDYNAHVRHATAPDLQYENEDERLRQWITRPGARELRDLHEREDRRRLAEEYAVTDPDLLGDTLRRRIPNLGQLEEAYRRALGAVDPLVLQEPAQAAIEAVGTADGLNAEIQRMQATLTNDRVGTQEELRRRLMDVDDLERRIHRAIIELRAEYDQQDLGRVRPVANVIVMELLGLQAEIVEHPGWIDALPLRQDRYFHLMNHEDWMLPDESVLSAFQARRQFLAMILGLAEDVLVLREAAEFLGVNMPDRYDAGLFEDRVEWVRLRAEIQEMTPLIDAVEWYDRRTELNAQQNSRFDLAVRSARDATHQARRNYDDVTLRDARHVRERRSYTLRSARQRLYHLIHTHHIGIPNLGALQYDRMTNDQLGYLLNRRAERIMYLSSLNPNLEVVGETDIEEARQAASSVRDFLNNRGSERPSRAALLRYLIDTEVAVNDLEVETVDDNDKHEVYRIHFGNDGDEDDWFDIPDFEWDGLATQLGEADMSSHDRGANTPEAARQATEDISPFQLDGEPGNEAGDQQVQNETVNNRNDQIRGDDAEPEEPVNETNPVVEGPVNETEPVIEEPEDESQAPQAISPPPPPKKQSKKKPARVGADLQAPGDEKRSPREGTRAQTKAKKDEEARKKADGADAAKAQADAGKKGNKKQKPRPKSHDQGPSKKNGRKGDDDDDDAPAPGAGAVAGKSSKATTKTTKSNSSTASTRQTRSKATSTGTKGKKRAAPIDNDDDEDSDSDMPIATKKPKQKHVHFISIDVPNNDDSGTSRPMPQGQVAASRFAGRTR